LNPREVGPSLDRDQGIWFLESFLGLLILDFLISFQIFVIFIYKDL
jgi:hypothetical protein